MDKDAKSHSVPEYFTKAQPQSYFWHGSKLLRLQKSRDGWQLHDGSAPYRDFPAGHEPGCQWSEWPEPWRYQHGCLIYVNQPDQDLWLWDLDKTQPCRLTQTQQLAGSPCYHNEQGAFWIEQPANPAATPAKVYCQPKGQPAPRILHESHHFYRHVVISKSGRYVIFFAWDRPCLPWESRYLYLVDLKTGDQAKVVAIHDHMVTQKLGPAIGFYAYEFISDDHLVFSARSGDWESLWRMELTTRTITRITRGRQSYQESPWNRYEPRLAYLPKQNRLLALGHRFGKSLVQSIDLNASPNPKKYELNCLAEIKSLAVDPGTFPARLAVAGSSWSQPSTIRQGRLMTNGKIAKLDAPFDPMRRDKRTLSPPERLCWRDSNHDTLYGWIYWPRDVAGPVPLILPLHGGPFQCVHAGWPLKAHYFNRLGYGVAYLNFKGSSGHGASYANDVQGHWGQWDVEGILAGIKKLQQDPRIAADRLAVWGGYAGAYTATKLLARNPDGIQAGILVYPLWDLAAIWPRLNACERDYRQRLVCGRNGHNAGPPLNGSLWQDLQQIRRPLQIFHGQKDRRVSWQLSTKAVEILKHQNVPVEYHVYPEADHRWTDPELLEDYYAKVEDFLHRTYKIAADQPSHSGL
jgi:dienelactone hydrolase